MIFPSLYARSLPSVSACSSAHPPTHSVKGSSFVSGRIFVTTPSSSSNTARFSTDESGRTTRFTAMRRDWDILVLLLFSKTFSPPYQ